MRLAIILLLCGPLFAGYQQAATSSDVTGGGSLSASATFASTPTAGNHILVACLTKNGNEVCAFSDNQGNSYTAEEHQQVSVGPNYMTVGSAKATTASGTFTVTCAKSASYVEEMRCVAIEYSGLASTAWLDVDTSAIGSSSGTHSSGNTATTAQADSAVIGWVWMSCGACNISAGSGFTMNAHYQASANMGHIGFESKTVSATGTYDSTFTDDQGYASWAAFVSVYKLASGGGSPAIIRRRIM
jgi:hypothetical protein